MKKHKKARFKQFSDNKSSGLFLQSKRITVVVHPGSTTTKKFKNHVFENLTYRNYK